MKPPSEGTQFHKLQKEPKKSLGFLHVKLQLRMTTGLNDSYMFQKPYPKPDVVSTVDIASLFSTVARLVNALLAPLTSFLACMQYLQKWKEPQLNLGILAGILIQYFLLFPMVDLFLPLHLGVWLLIQGHCLARIRQFQFVPLNKEQYDLWYKGTKDRTKALLNRVLIEEAAVKDKIRAELIKDNTSTQVADPDDLEDSTEKESNKQLVQEKRGEGANFSVEEENVEVKKTSLFQKLGGKVTGVMDSVNLAKKFERLKAPLRSLQNIVIYYTDILEKTGNVFNQKDKQLSMLAAPYVLIYSLLFSIVWMVLVIIYRAFMVYCPIGFRHLILLMWLVLLLPMSDRTKQFIASIDQYLMLLSIEMDPISYDSVNVIKARLEKQESQLKNMNALREVVKKEMEAEEKLKRQIEEQNALYCDAQVYRENTESMREGAFLSAQWFKAHAMVPFYLYLRSPVNREQYHREICSMVQLPAPDKNLVKMNQKNCEQLLLEEAEMSSQRTGIATWFGSKEQGKL
uniref:Uncharacterized protein n=1 Tax=Polyblepharides amylifera TaxID=1486889 RepID=A0A7R9XN38_9CHLO|mmetsp:Transcript_46/g.64  ORF Transcript_46/g.64 Transcript_46/m.64 type:complete len:515 (+) Transcript_46:1854-3398(+)